MSRWQPDASERLKSAALELFTEQGFAATTVPEIAARAGLTTRTFFRYFADKREVLFDGDEIPRYAARLMAEAPPAQDPMTSIVEGLRIGNPARFEGRRDEVRQWRAIIQTDEGLRERDLHKRAALSGAIRDGFLSRGIDPLTAAVIAETGVTLLHVALDEWTARDDDRPLFDIVLTTLEALRAQLIPPVGRGVAQLETSLVANRAQAAVPKTAT
jgi:AcrR family transcriptional regulator